jgi:hypothetical protein
MANTISKQIIYGTDGELAQFLAINPELDIIDEYGYTPLIQAVIVNSVTKTRLILEANAKVDFPDLTGRTALHWAASNSNYELIELLLQNHANPNAYTISGQPVLVMPLLKREQSLVKLLTQYGASLDFAKDFINVKQLGHRFELIGRADVVDNTNTFIEADLEGFYFEFNLAMVANSLQEFHNNFGGKHLRDYFPKLDIITRCLHNAARLIKYQHYLHLLDIDKFDNEINTLLDSDPLILPLAYDGHAITFIKFWDLLVRCDRGEFGRDNGTVIIYRMPSINTLSPSICKTLLYKRQSRNFINESLAKQLGLKKSMTLPLSPQISGNCSWANVEAVVPAMLFLLLVNERGAKDIEQCQKDAFFVYNEWVEWDRNRELHFCLQSFYDANPARKAAKATILAAILFQYCDYENRKDLRKARRILAILGIPEYDYILKSYFQVFGKDQNNRMLENLRRFCRTVK